MTQKNIWKCPTCGKRGKPFPTNSPSFCSTIRASKEWHAWENYQEKLFSQGKYGKCFDVDECGAVDIMSERHWQEFVKFIRRLK